MQITSSITKEEEDKDEKVEKSDDEKKDME